jgi:O-antigen/teichoic acid export membrane protein
LKEEEQINTKINFKSSSFKKYFANTTWLVGEKLTRLLLTFFVGILLVRYLGPEQFGIFSYSLSFVTLFAALSILGIEKIVVRELVDFPENENEIMGSAFLLRILGTTASLVFIFIGILITGDTGITLTFIIIISSIIVFRSVQVIDYYYQAKVTSKYSVYAQFFSLVIGSLLKLAFIFFNVDLIYFAVTIALENLTMALILIYTYKRQNLNLINWKASKSISIKIIRESWPLIISSLAIIIYLKIDQIMLKQMLDEKEVGFYAAAVQLCEAWYFLPTVITGSLFPAILNAKKKSTQLYEDRFQKLIDLLAWVSIGIAIPVFFFSEVIIELLYGNEFAASASVLAIYIWAGVPTFLSSATGQFLVAENLTKLTIVKNIPGVILNILLNLLLIPKYGIVGSAVATLVSYSSTLLVLGFIKKTNSIFIMSVKSLFLITLFQHALGLIHKHMRIK